jgi:hypothetical protein
MRLDHKEVDINSLNNIFKNKFLEKKW